MNITSIFRKRDIAGKYYRFYFVTNYSYFLGFLIHALFIYFFHFLDIPLMVEYNIFSTSLFLTAFILNRKAYHNLALILIVCEIPIHAALATHFLGWESGFFVYIMALIPLTFFNPAWNYVIKVVLAILVTSFTIGLKYYAVTTQPATMISADLVNYFYYINIFFFYLVLSFLTYYYSLAAKLSEDELQHSYDQIDILARTDPLTKLANRRDILEKLDLESRRCVRQNGHMAIIIADIDEFKLFNDQYGHDCGDHVLVTVAQKLSQSLRHNDYIGRWGGEEFLLILPDTGKDEAVKVAEKLRKMIRSEKVTFAGSLHTVSLTFGISIYDGTSAVQKSITEADKALLVGKQAGKNQVNIY